MEIPEIHVLNQIRWQFFGTLTFRSDRLSERKRYGACFTLLRKISRQYKVPFDRLLWVLRREDGEKTGRTHFHYLLAGLDRRYENSTTCFWLMHRWETLRGGGHSRVEVFDPRLNAGSYILKGLGNFNDSTLGGGFYESAKFSSEESQLTIADAVWTVAERRLKRR
ncbi:MAG: hypothetical protein HRU46_17030 [Verrucomicrobiales bacterium]|nr:hypothetical protein [Verrucomicrobiales bacterium]